MNHPANKKAVGHMSFPSFRNHDNLRVTKRGNQKSKNQNNGSHDGLNQVDSRDGRTHSTLTKPERAEWSQQAMRSTIEI